jgi:hypothetical protein
MAGVLLAAFPLLLLFAPRFAWLAVAVAILLLVGKRLSAARTVAHRHVDSDASI